VSEAVAAAALALVGTRFGLHGRSVTHGLDCVGLAAAAHAAAGVRLVVPTGYALRGGDPAEAIAAIDAQLRRADGARAGDLLLFAVGAGQLHLAIRAGDGIVHADMALRRVVARPGAAGWPLLGGWRS